MSFTRSRRARALAAGALSAAVLSTGTAGAVAATGTPTPKPTMTRTGMPTMKPSRTAMGSITVSADHKAVKMGDTVLFTGRVKGIKAGSTLVLQHKHNGKWTTLRTTAAVSKNGTYTIKRTFTNKGTEQVRVATKSGTFHSSPVTVKVS